MSLNKCKIILIAVDFSSDSRVAVDEGLALAKMAGADVILHHVIHDLPENPGFYHKKKDKKKSVHLMSDAAEDMMKEFIKESGAGSFAKKNKIKITTSTSSGLPASAIIKAAKKSNASVIVVGTSGRSGLAKLLIGSNAQRVVQLSKIPVLVVQK
ncbi:MAG: universal stress protein [Magnetococcales bacterium]|nr:universal stress protein [Magnetococcales bacterium]